MRHLAAALLLAMTCLPAGAEELWCVGHSGAELFEIPANRYLEAYLESGTRKDQRKACEWSRKTLRAWIDGLVYCNDRTHCRDRKFRARCKLIAERADLWKRAETQAGRGL